MVQSFIKYDIIPSLVEISTHRSEDPIPSCPVFLVHRKDVHYEYEIKNADTISQGKKVVLVGFPGVFTPVCASTHLHEFTKLYHQFQAKGAELIPITVNDAFAVKPYAENARASMPVIAESDGVLTRALDSGDDLSEKGLGFRSRRFSVVVNDGIIIEVNDENSIDMAEVSRADTVLKNL